MTMRDGHARSDRTIDAMIGGSRDLDRHRDPIALSLRGLERQPRPTTKKKAGNENSRVGGPIEAATTMTATNARKQILNGELEAVTMMTVAKQSTRAGGLIDTTMTTAMTKRSRTRDGKQEAEMTMEMTMRTLDLDHARSHFLRSQLNAV